MIDINLTNEDLLSYAISNGIINMNSVRECVMQKKIEHYLSMHPYKIFQDKDGRWKTTLPDASRKNGRRLIAKKDLEVLQDVVVKFYEAEEKRVEEEREKAANPILRISANITLEELYPIWFESRRLEVRNIRTLKKNHQQWKRYYVENPIIKIPMNQLTVNELKDWAHRMIEDNELNKRDYYDMTLIMKKCYEFLSDEEICEDTWAKAKRKVNLKKLKKMSRPENETEVYFHDERISITQHALKMFALRPWNIGVLTIPFLFLTGMRIGEVVALKYSDLQESEISIKNGEVNDFIFFEEEFEFRYAGKKVEDYTKSEAGTRRVPFTESAKKIIELVKRSSSYYGYYDDDYIFCPGSKRMVANSIDHTLHRYCLAVGMTPKSAHKIRKTYISLAFSNQIDLDTICKIAGHVDLKTTFQSYIFSLERKDDVYLRFNEIFQNAVV